jgi:polyisoprenoid-binding protein YceI
MLLVAVAGTARLPAQEPGKPAPAPAAKPADPNAPAVSGDYQVDPVHSTNVFRIRHMNITFVYGRFNETSGTFKLDEAKPEASTFEISLKTASIDTNNADRDKHLRSPDFFDAEKYPTITFKSTKVQKTDNQHWTLTGDLTLHGVTKPITATITTPVASKGMRGGVHVGFETTFEIKRSDYGMSNSLGPIGDEVRITVSIEGTRP